MNEDKERGIRDLFDIGLVLKALMSVLELGSGIAVLFVSRMTILRVIEFATQGELTYDPDNFVANYLRSAAHTFSIHTHYLLAAYLIVRGALKLALIILILCGVMVACPIFIIVLGLFASYEAYRAILTSNVLLGLVGLFDTVLIFLTAYEYKRRTAHSVQNPGS